MNDVDKRIALHLLDGAEAPDFSPGRKRRLLLFMTVCDTISSCNARSFAR
jgi:hypothetical protein